MRQVLALGLTLAFCTKCIGQKHKNQQPFPAEVVIGRDTFFDFGPPFHYYDLTFLRSEGEKTEVERVSLTPPADTCYPRAEIKTVHVGISQPLSAILNDTNPCEIPEKALKAELKRKKKGPVFSGMVVSIQTQCAVGTRVIRTDVLDRDIFGDQKKTPKYTSWSRMLFDKLDEATGQSPWEKPVFPLAEVTTTSASTLESSAMQAIADGEYDMLFGQTADRPSALYRLAKDAPSRLPFIELKKSDPVRPITYVSPVYPPIAKAARVQGSVEFHLSIGRYGAVENTVIESGPKMLWQAVSEATAKWKFPAEDEGKLVQASIGFGLNCAADSR